MRKNSFGENVIAFLVVIGIFVFIGMIGQASEAKCIKSGCDNKQASGSSYCYLHKPYSSKSSSSYSNKTSGSSSKSSSGGSNSYTGNTGTTTSSSYNNSSTKKSKTTKKSTYESYDDGYDDIYMDGDYDYDRYRTDSNYADGVDDAMDEFGEEW